VIERPIDEGRADHCASRALGSAPLIGVRAKLSSRSTGRWGSSVGERPVRSLGARPCWPPFDTAARRIFARRIAPAGTPRGPASQTTIAVLKGRPCRKPVRSTCSWPSSVAPLGLPRRGRRLGIDYGRSRTPPAASQPLRCQTTPSDVWPPCASAASPHGIPLPTLVRRERPLRIASHFSGCVFRRARFAGQGQWRGCRR